MLAMHDDVQERLFEEVKNVVDGDITETHLQKLNYLEMVVKESMRLFPVLPIHARIAKEDVELENFTIPAGANIVISVFNAHRNKKTWGDDADQFRPERFLPENFEKLHPYAFLPFSRGNLGNFQTILESTMPMTFLPLGPRKCIGWRYSMFFMKTTLAYLVKNFKFSTSLKYENLEYEIALTMKIAQKYQVRMTKRQ